MDANDSGLYEMQADIFKAIGHPIRLRIVRYLGKGEKAVSDIVQAVDAEQSNVSRHLALLKQSGVLKSRKSGLRVFYGLSSKLMMPALEQMLLCVEDIMRGRLRVDEDLLARATRDQ